jgi:membrane-bound ClpP family serine protease
MDWFIVFALLALGWLLLFLEIFFIPGITVLVVIGALLMAAGIIFSFAHYGNEIGWYTLLGTVAFVTLSLIVAFKSGFWKGLSLKDENTSRMNTFDQELVKPGTIGRSMSRIAPSGKAMFGSETFEVHSESGFIDPNTALVVVKIYLNRIIVKPVTS